MKDLLSVGFMVFSIFFGAGNLIFPPLLAQNAGTSFPIAIVGFLITGIGLPLLGLVAIVKAGGKYTKLVEKRVHPVFRVITFGILFLAIGPLFAVPRTGAVSFEIGIKSFLAVDDLMMGQAVYTALFFVVTYIFAANPTKLVDTIGKVLSPLLLLFLCVLFVRTFYA
ncbi:MAG: branched-chain amino acid transport system II carrier protein, partial [Anaerovibrio sp.]|nr:branched-chain amino acid transport system II carrier protein [Anaerovibrio sp.]